MYQALYRKYRPKKFEDVYGQNIIIKTLKNAIINRQIGHAYMFSGPRGTGKTTIAKILARSVNCLNPIEGEACEKCTNCINSFSKECIDVIEIDAASNNGVDEIRELKNKVNIVPSELKYKVYIIDEVHMLSIGAFNALLKTLEEPPEHVIFILATTDPQKVPITIISRCQCYNFKRIDDASMYERLKKIVEIENFQVDDAVLKEIIYAADGGLRDAIGLLDKITSYKNSLITLEDFYEVNGTLMIADLQKLVESIFLNFPKRVIQLIEQFSKDGKDLTQVTKQILYFLKDQLIKFYTENTPLKYDEDKIIVLINNINERMFEIKQAGDVKIYVEIFFLNFMHTFLNKIPNRLETNVFLENKIRNSSETKKDEEITNLNSEKKEKLIDFQSQEQTSEIIHETTLHETSINLTEIKKKMLLQAHNILATASKAQLLNIKENWKILEDFTFDSQIGYVVCYLMDGTLRAANDESLILSYEYEAMIEKILPSLEKMTEIFSNIISIPKKLVLITDENWNSLKEEFINCKQKGIPFEILKEPISKENSLETHQQEKISEIPNKILEEDETLALFGDIVEIK